MKEIELSLGKFAIVDDDDFESLQRFNWFTDGKYAMRNIPNGPYKQKQIRMHNDIMKPPPGFVVDHINRDKLDNRKSNLRICTPMQNQANLPKTKRGVTSKYFGVCFDRRVGKFKVAFMVNHKTIYVGHFENEVDAAVAYDDAVGIHRREFANFNFKSKKQRGIKA